MNRIAVLAGAFAAILASVISTDGARAIETDAKQAIVVEFETGTVLYRKDADSIMYPASMTKMMTAYLLFERLKNGSLSLEDTFRVSEAAWRKGGSKMFVKVGDRVSVEDLIRGIVCSPATTRRSSWRKASAAARARSRSS